MKVTTAKGSPVANLDQVLPSRPRESLLPFHKMDEKVFELICVDIVDNELNIVRADLKRTGGQRQFGVDVEGFDEHQRPAIVLSAKRYQFVRPSQLMAWSVDFLMHIDGHWAGRGVERFVLAVTVELNNDDLNASIERETRRFKEHDIVYEVWGLKQLTTKLRPHPEIVRAHFNAAWVEAVCGITHPASAGLVVPLPTDALPRDDAGEIGKIMASTADAVAKRLGKRDADALDSALLDLKEGRSQPLRKFFGELQEDRLRWKLLPPDILAKILRAEAALALQDGDLQLARRCYTEAGELVNPANRRLEGLLARWEDGPEAAVDRVGKPQCLAEAQLLAGLLIEADNAAEVEPLLDLWPPTDDDRAEDLRLRALARSALRNDERAIVAAQEAERLTPRSFAVLWAGAVVLFTSALSPLLHYPPTLVPEAINPRLFRDDARSRRRLDESERLFDRLCHAVDEAGRRADLVVWRLACLLGNPARRTDAEELANSLLNEPVPHTGVVAWAFAAGLAVPRDRLVKEYTRLLEAGQGSVSHVLAVAWLHLAHGNVKRARNSLAKLGGRLVSERDRVVVKTAAEGLSLNRQAAGRASPQVRFRQAIKALEAGDPECTIALIERNELDPEAIFAALEALAANGHWAVLDRLRSRVLEFATPAAVELAARAAIETARPEGPDFENCVGILEGSSDLFFERRLPHRLGLLLAEARARSGRPDLALKQYDELRQLPTSAAAAVRGRIQTLASIGDLKGLSQVLSEVGPRQSLRDQDAVVLARMLRHEDPVLARSLAAGVDPSCLPIDVVPTALDFAHQMGLEDWGKILFTRATQLASAEGTAVMVIDDVDDLLEMLKQRSEHARMSRERWLNAEAPMHLLFERQPETLARLFHVPFVGPPAGPSSIPDDRLPLLLRVSRPSDHSDHGKSLDKPLDELRMDITALLLGHEIDVLDRLASIAGTISIAPETPQTLIELEEALEAGSGPYDAKALLEAIDHRVVVTVEKGSAAADGALPLVALMANPQPGVEHGTDLTIDLMDLLEALVERDGLDASHIAAVLRYLDQPTRPPAAVELPTDRRMRIELEAALTLAAAGALAAVGRFVRLHLTQDEVKELRNRVEAAALRRDHWRSLGRLRAFVADKLRSGTWQLLPDRPLDERHEDLAHSRPVLRGFASLIRAKSGPAAAVWVEDRYVSQFGQINECPVLDCLTVLDRLLAAGAIDWNGYRMARERLRRAGYSFWLPEADEVIDALQEAPLHNSEIVETERLALLRVSSAMQAVYSQYFTAQPGSPGFRFVSQLVRQASVVIAGLWNTEAAEESRPRATSSWVWRNLRVEPYGGLFGEDMAIAQRRQIVRLGLQSLISATVSFIADSPAKVSEQRRGCLAWAFGEIIYPFTVAEPGGEEALVEECAASIEAIFSATPPEPDEPEAFREAFVHHWLQDFPQPWTDRLLAHPRLRNRYPTRTVTRVSLGKDLDFDAEAFYPALKAMLEHGSGEAVTSDGFVRAVFTPAESAEDGKGFKVQAGNQGFWIKEESYLLAHPDQATRRSAIVRHPEWLDRSGAALEAAASEIADAGLVEDRFRILREMQSQGLWWRLDTLSRQIRDHEAVDVALILPPAPEVLRAYLRLPGLMSTGEDCSAAALRLAVRSAAKELTETFGPLEAVKRLSGIPVAMPRATTQAVAAAIDEHAGDLSALLQKTGRTPMILTALAHAERQHGVDLSNEASAILKGFFEVHAELGEFFLAVLRWVHRRAACEQSWQKISEPERSLLLWAYANALTMALTEARVSPKPAVDYLSHLDQMPLIDLVIEQYKGSCSWLAMISPLGYPSHRALATVSLAHVSCAAEADHARGDYLSVEELCVVQPLVNLQNGDRLSPILELLIPEPMSYSAFAKEEVSGTWLGIDSRQKLHQLGVIKLPAELLGSADEISNGLIDRITNRDSGPGECQAAWLILLLMDPSRFDRAIRQRLSDLPPHDDAAQLLGDKNIGRTRILSFRARLLAADRDRACFGALLAAAVDSVVAEFGTTARVGYDLSSEHPAVRAFLAIADAILAFNAQTTDTRQSLIAELAIAVELVVDRWPGALHGSLALLDRAVRGVSTADGAPAWEVICRLRQR